VSGEVIDLSARRPKAEYCFTCPCDSQVFVLRPDARIECGACGKIQDRLLWGQYFVSPSGQIDSTPIPHEGD
jgi:hypothetical protein